MGIAVRRLGFLAAGLTPLLLAAVARAVILYGTPDRNGTPAPGSVAEIPWSLQGQWGPFMGTPIAPSYFITAIHVGFDPNTNFTFRGTTYTIDTSYGNSGAFDIAGSDLRIWKVNGTFPAFAPLYGTSSTASEGNKPMVVMGRGTQRGAEVTVNGVLKGWQWGNSDLEQSWGQNTITGVVTGNSQQGEFIAFDFNPGNLPNEGTLSGFDSSGGVFVQSGTEWQLAGINYGVDGPFSLSGDANDPGFNAAIFDSSGLFTKDGNNNWQPAPGGPTTAYSSRINGRLTAIYAAIPSFAINQQQFFVRGTTVDVGTVNASTSVTVGTATSAATLKASYIRGGSLIINRASHVLIKPNGSDANVSHVNTLTFNGSAIGQLDLTDNDMIVQSPTNPGQDLSFVILRIQSGRNGTANRWGGNGITSSSAAADVNQLMGLGAILNDNGHGGPIYSTFDGMAVDMNSILIKYTLMGDLNLNGKIDPDDFFYMDRGFALGYNPANPYLNGDIDYNGQVNADDYAIIDRAYAMQLSAATAPATLSLGIAAVPEPATVGLLTFLLPVFVRRRRIA